MGVLRASLIALGVGLLLPAGVGAAPGCLRCHPSHYAGDGPCARCHRGDERTDRKNVAHRDLIPGAYASFAIPGSPAEKRGAALIEALSCRRCHTFRGEGNALAANFDDVPAVSAPRRIHASIRTPALFMPDFRLADRRIPEVVTAILAAGARRGTREGKEIPLVVLFEDADSKESPFSKSCGGCHRVLSDTRGGLGTGAIGPDLSGLFTRHYPATFGKGERWTPDNLRKWLRNPRAVKPGASMPPVPLEPREADEVVRAVAGAGGPAR